MVRLSLSWRLASLGLLLAGCAAAPPDTAAEVKPSPDPQAAHILNAPVADLTAYVLVRTDGGQLAPEVTSLSAAADVLAGYDVIFLGEAHRHPGNHLAQMALFREIHQRAPNLGLSMEQFERDAQTVVDDYLAGKIGENILTAKGKAWDNYATSYRPLIEYAKDHKLPVIAAEAPTMVVRCVGREGPGFLARMKPEQRGWAAAELNLQDGPYKDKFLGFAGTDAGHGGDPKQGEDKAKRQPSETALRSFAAQVTRDDTMAESIALHLRANPGRKVVHLNGSFHSESFLGTVERLQLRMPNLKIAVVNPIQVEDSARPTLKNADLKTGTFLLLIRPLPEPYANDAEMEEAIKKQMAARAKTSCEL